MALQLDWGVEIYPGAFQEKFSSRYGLWIPTIAGMIRQSTRLNIIFC